MKSILDKTFGYVNSANTDIRKTFERLCPGWQSRKPTPKVVTPIQGRRKQ